MMSGFMVSIMASSCLPFFLTDLKFMFKIRRCLLLGFGLWGAPGCLGDEVIVGSMGPFGGGEGIVDKLDFDDIDWVMFSSDVNDSDVFADEENTEALDLEFGSCLELFVLLGESNGML